jgi:hypothetical protein
MRVAAVIIGLGWLPYVILRAFWEFLLLTVPGASHGEVSGPILYFLPRLLQFAIVYTIVASVITFAVSRTQKYWSPVINKLLQMF